MDDNPAVQRQTLRLVLRRLASTRANHVIQKLWTMSNMYQPVRNSGKSLQPSIGNHLPSNVHGKFTYELLSFPSNGPGPEHPTPDVHDVLCYKPSNLTIL